MKLANHLTIRLVSLFVVIIIVWSAVYFFMQMYEIYHDIDEGLTNLKQEFIVQANDDARFVEAMEKYNPINMIVEEISYDIAIDIKEQHSTTKVFFETEDEFEEVRILSTAFRCENNGKYYSIKFFTSTVETDDLIANMLVLLIILWLTLSISMILGSQYIIKKSNKPFNDLLNELEHFSLNDRTMITFTDSGIAEYQKLNVAVETLLERNIASYEEQKNFIENASHELQTPITIIINKIELMINDSQLSEEQTVEFSSILTNLNRMKRLNQSLLLLSKIRNKQFIEEEDISINSIVNTVIDNFSDIIDHRGIILQKVEDSILKVNMNSDLAYIMINNLIKNAVNHNLSNGTIDIHITTNSLSISNNGNPIPDHINIFERYTSNNKNSTGLGLSIVSTIISVYKFRITHKFDDKHIVTIFF